VSYGGSTISQTAHSSFCSAYHNAYATYNGTDVSPYAPQNTVTSGSSANGVAIHPSEPNYVFMESGSNLSKYDDNDPYGSTNSVLQISNFLAAHPAFTGENLCSLLQNAGISWTSYTEGTCLLNSAGQDFNLHTTSGGATLTNNVSPIGTRTVPLVSFSGTVTGSTPTYTNPYNGSHQYNFAVKHTGSLFFPATNGSTTTTANQTTTNVEVAHYEPLESLAGDLAANTQSQYVVITPDQYNDGHTALSATFTYHNYGGTASGVNQTFTGGSDLARVGQMDNFCAIMVPEIMSSPVYQAGHAAIVIWTDETEGSPTADDFYHTLTEIVISPYAKGNAYNSPLNYTHASDLATMQEIFGVTANTATGFLNDAANPSIATPSGTTAVTNTGTGLQTATGQPYFGFGTGTATDLSDLFVSGTIPALPALTTTASGFVFNRRLNADVQTVTITNTTSSPITTPIYFIASSLSSNTSLTNKTGSTSTDFPGSPYITVASSLAANASVLITLDFSAPTSGSISYNPEVVVSSTAP
jgi:hypothetical protein